MDGWMDGWVGGWSYRCGCGEDRELCLGSGSAEVDEGDDAREGEDELEEEETPGEVRGVGGKPSVERWVGGWIEEKEAG